VTLELDREVPYHDERIANPDRVFLDLRGVHPGRRVRHVQKFETGAVRQVRVGERPDDVTRVVLEIDGTASHSVFAMYNPYRLVIDCTRPPQNETTSRPEAGGPGGLVPQKSSIVGTTGPVPDLPAPAPPAPPSGIPASAAPAGTPHASDITSHDDPRDGGESPPAPGSTGPAATNLKGRFSLSRQLGLGIARIVIDPGHGGHDPGAQVKGLNESELVLDVALRLEQLLLSQRGVEVVMTRRTDTFVPLEQRTAIANREGADLFLSIHANASRDRKARGIETYFLNFASNHEAEAVAARENAASDRTMHSLPDIVRAITLNDKLDESRDFATMVQRSMVDRMRGRNKALRDLGVKQAPFVVLIGAAMPSVLTEISFVTNTQEAKLLRGSAYRQRIAEALVGAIRKYQTSLKNVPTVAHQ